VVRSAGADEQAGFAIVADFHFSEFLNDGETTKSD